MAKVEVSVVWCCVVLDSFCRWMLVDVNCLATRYEVMFEVRLRLVLY